MADRKLVACIGYTLRLAQRQKEIDVAGHLWHGLYSLTKTTNVTVRIKKPISLYSALGFSDMMSESISTVLVDDAPSQGCDPSIQTQSKMQTSTVVDVDSSALRSGAFLHEKSSDKGNPDNEGCFVQARGELDCRESATQTELEVISRPQFELIMDGMKKQVENLSAQVAQLSHSVGEPISTRIMSRCEPSAEASNVSSSVVMPWLPHMTLEEVQARAYAKKVDDRSRRRQQRLQSLGKCADNT